MLEGDLKFIGAQLPLFPKEEPEAQEREWCVEATSLVSSRTWCKGHVPIFQISDRSVSAHWWSGLAGAWLGG